MATTVRRCDTADWCLGGRCLPAERSASARAGSSDLERRHSELTGVRFLAHDDFFVFEPQVNATVQVIPHVGVEVGGGYRLSGATNALEDRLNGVSGSVGVQLAW